MMNVLRGDVMLVDYPYTDRTGSKVRPCTIRVRVVDSHDIASQDIHHGRVMWAS